MYHHLLRISGCLVVMFWLVGCSGLDMGTEIQVPAGQRHEITRLEFGAAAFDLPADRFFNIHLKTSTQTPGSNGTASGNADATEAGSAYCLAEATKGGEAAGEFRLGQRLANQTGEVLEAVIQTDCRLDCRIAASEPPGPETLAEAALHLVILDSRRRTLADVPVKTLDSDSQLGRATTTEQHTLRVRMHPDRWYDVFLLGRAHARTGADKRARIRVDLQKLQMRVRAQPVSAQSQPDTVSGE